MVVVADAVDFVVVCMLVLLLWTMVLKETVDVEAAVVNDNCN